MAAATPLSVLSPIKIGNLECPNRVFMAPLTRIQATTLTHIPSEQMVRHYSERASAGLLIAEATMITAKHSAFLAEPGIYSSEQIAAWRKVTDAVHAKGGRIFLQIWHGGRACLALNDGEQPVSSCATAVEGHKIPGYFTSTGEAVPYETPRELSDAEIPQVIETFVQGARNAIEAGFDGVEIHGANGYLLDQFWRDGINKRSGPYGGSIENRSRLMLEVVERVSAAIGASRVGLRLSPLNSYNGAIDSNPEALTRYLCKELAKLEIAYIHFIRVDFFQAQKGDILTWARESYKGIIIGNAGYTKESADEQIASGLIDAVAFGTKFLANPDLPERFAKSAPLNEPRADVFYSRTEVGYNDYPALPAQ